jgi:hypothetical protein
LRASVAVVTGHPSRRRLVGFHSISLPVLKVARCTLRSHRPQCVGRHINVTSTGAANDRVGVHLGSRLVTAMRVRMNDTIHGHKECRGHGLTRNRFRRMRSRRCRTRSRRGSLLCQVVHGRRAPGVLEQSLFFENGTTARDHGRRRQRRGRSGRPYLGTERWERVRDDTVQQQQNGPVHRGLARREPLGRAILPHCRHQRTPLVSKPQV